MRIPMNIKTAKYLKAPIDNPDNKNTSIMATIDNETLFVPLDPNNRHYKEILKQVEEGTLTIEDAD